MAIFYLLQVQKLHVGCLSDFISMVMGKATIGLNTKAPSLPLQPVIPGLVGKMLHDKKIESKHGSGKVMRGLKGEQYGIS